VIADRTAYDVRYSYKPFSGIALLSKNIYLFKVSNWSMLLIPFSILWLLSDLCVPCQLFRPAMTFNNNTQKNATNRSDRSITCQNGTPIIRIELKADETLVRNWRHKSTIEIWLWFLAGELCKYGAESLISSGNKLGHTRVLNDDLWLVVDYCLFFFHFTLLLSCKRSCCNV